MIDRQDGCVPFKAMALLALMCILWGGNMVSIKAGNAGIPPILAAGLRNAVASFCLFLYAKFKGERLFFERADLKHGLAMGALFGFDFLLLYWGTAYTDASRAVIFLYTQPLWIALGAHFFLPAERLSFSKGLGLSVAFLGLVIVFSSRSSGAGQQHWLGDLMEVGAALFWATSIIYIKKFLSYRPVSPIQTLFVQLFFSIPLLLIAALVFEWGDPIVVTLPLVANFLYQSVVVAFFTYVLYLWMVHKYPVSRLAVFTFLTPLFGVLLSALLLNEALTALLAVGLALVSTGIYLVNRSTQRKE
jgi:drug/metabolite transporter (DMT)-like permease